MREVTLYTTNRKRVQAYGSIPVHTLEPLEFSSNSPDVFIKRDVMVDHLQIKRFCFRQEDGTIEDRFAAFDRELDEVIDVMLNDYTRSLQSCYRETNESLTAAFESRIKDLESRSLWDMIKLKFSKVWLTK